jgi:hypothetical protein
MSLKNQYDYFNNYVSVLKDYHVYEYEKVQVEEAQLKDNLIVHNRYKRKKIVILIMTILSFITMISTITKTPDFPLCSLLCFFAGSGWYYWVMKKMRDHQYLMNYSEKMIKGGRERLRLLFLNHHFRRALIATSYILEQNNVMHINDYRAIQDAIINKASDELYQKLLTLEKHMHTFLDNLDITTRNFNQAETNRQELMNELFSQENAIATVSIYKPVLKIIRA